MDDKQFYDISEEYFLLQLQNVGKRGIEKERLKRNVWNAIIKDFPELDTPLWKYRFTGDKKDLKFTDNQFNAAIKQAQDIGFFGPTRFENGEPVIPVNIEKIKKELEL